MNIESCAVTELRIEKNAKGRIYDRTFTGVLRYANGPGRLSDDGHPVTGKILRATSEEDKEAAARGSHKAIITHINGKRDRRTIRLLVMPSGDGHLFTD